jgi:F0F1-type ATP synthase membrane subunit c/vacuolar-type H+-ATPase subunit K
MDLTAIPLAEVTDEGVKSAGKAIALGVGAARQPEMKSELESIRWLGFALTEAVAFYTFIFGLIAFFLA